MNTAEQVSGAEGHGPRILIVDDDPGYCNELAAYLRAYGFLVRAVSDVGEVEKAVIEASPDLILLDQRLGPVTGTDVLRRLRGWSAVPCIIVTGAPDATDRILNLEFGADDEVDKAVPPRELLARIRAVLRRRGPAGAGPVLQTPSRPNGGWEFSAQLRELRRPDGSLCHLTSAEFGTLHMLVLAGGKPVRRALICERVFGRPFRPGDRSVDTVITKLRRKLDPSGSGDCIKAVRPLGYVFTGFPAPAE